MKHVIAGLIAGAAFFGAVAAADTMANIFGNTVTTTGADGATVRWTFNPDNSYAVTLPNGATGAGSWAVAEGQLCVTPNDGSPRQCAALADNKAAGDTWTTTNDAGETITVAILAGR